MVSMDKRDIYLIESKKRSKLAKTFMRLQEYYESPVFGGRPFSIKEFSDWYSMEYGAFTYAQDWAGFNIPSWVLKPFLSGDFNPLTKKERNLLGFFKNNTDKFYVIGVSKDDYECSDVLKHEFVHGLFYTNDRYRQDVITCLKDHQPKVIISALEDLGYGDNVIDDETNAYLLVEPKTLEDYVSVSGTHRLRMRLNSIFKKHFNYDILTVKPEDLLNKMQRIMI
jgi:hypothetical protein